MAHCTILENHYFHTAVSAWLMWGTELEYITDVQNLSRHFSEFCDFLAKVFQKEE